MINGVIIREVKRHSDDRGYFSEIARCDDLDFSKIGQVSISKIYPGVIKAFHCHEKQTDLWYVLKGNVQIALYDDRETSSTFKETETIFMGEDNLRIIIIPPGIQHGYKVLGNEEVEMLYIASDVYNPLDPDETKNAFDNAQINYDWSLKFK